LRLPLPGAETALLRALVRASSDDVPPPAFSDSIDWALLVASAERHRLGPLVFEGLSRAGSAPAGVLARLENVRNLELAKAVVRLHHLDEIGAAAVREGIDLCLLKGAAFATTLYRDPGLRPMADIDLLSSPATFEHWSHALEELGYSLVDVSDHASCYRRRATGVLVELSASDFLGLETPSILARSKPFEGRLRTLSWEDHLLHLCLHGSFQHGFRQPGLNAWDARAIAERDDFDAASFIARAGHPRLAPWVYGGLAMTQAVFDSPRLAAIRVALDEFVPRAIARKARRFQAESLLSAARDAIFGSPTERIRWSGWNLTTLSLLREISRPRPPRGPERPASRAGRILQLLSNHGFAQSSSTSNTPLALMLGRILASLGEVRDV
jgi:hypothetical protein